MCNVYLLLRRFAFSFSFLPCAPIFFPPYKRKASGNEAGLGLFSLDEMLVYGRLGLVPIPTPTPRVLLVCSNSLPVPIYTPRVERGTVRSRVVSCPRTQVSPIYVEVQTHAITIRPFHLLVYRCPAYMGYQSAAIPLPPPPPPSPPQAFVGLLR